MDDLISRQVAINTLRKIRQKEISDGRRFHDYCSLSTAVDVIKDLPSVQSEQTEMIKEIRKWINSGNRGNADYFIVDKIEEIINKYE